MCAVNATKCCKAAFSTARRLWYRYRNAIADEGEATVFSGPEEFNPLRRIIKGETY